MQDERTTQQDEDVEVEGHSRGARSAPEPGEQPERQAEPDRDEEVEAHGRSWASPSAPESRGA